MGRDHGVVAIAGQIGVVASVALNLAALAFYLHGRIFGAGVGEKEAGKKMKKAAAVAPSSGKPPVAPDSTINLDQ
jgi:L-tryptophan--pyruvate aminotransferase